MPDDVAHYPRYRFPPAIISHAVWLYYRFTLSFRDVEDLLAQRGVTVSYESIRHWCETFGAAYARRLRCRVGLVGDTWHLDELFVTIRGQRQYLWRAVDQDGEVIDILLQPRRDRHAAARFLRKLLKRTREYDADDYSIPIGSRYHPERAPLWAPDSPVEGTEEWIARGRGIEEPVTV